MSRERNIRLHQSRRFLRMTVRVRVEIEIEGEFCSGMATTLGAGGLFIEMENPFMENTPLNLRFRLPASDRTFEIAGRVVWTTRPPFARKAASAGDSRAERSGESLGMGIEFTDRVAIAALARELESLAGNADNQT